MLISLVGKPAESLRTELDAVGIQYKHRPPSPGTVTNAGMTIEVIGVSSAVVWAVATAFATWMRSKESRQVVITTKDGEVFYVAGMSPDDIAKLLKIAIGTSVFDPGTAPAAESHREKR